jgi:hypothetical protein
MGISLTFGAMGPKGIVLEKTLNRKRQRTEGGAANNRRNTQKERKKVGQDNASKIQGTTGVMEFAFEMLRIYTLFLLKPT